MKGFLNSRYFEMIVAAVPLELPLELQSSTLATGVVEPLFIHVKGGLQGWKSTTIKIICKYRLK